MIVKRPSIRKSNLTTASRAMRKNIIGFLQIFMRFIFFIIFHPFMKDSALSIRL